MCVCRAVNVNVSRKRERAVCGVQGRKWQQGLHTQRGVRGSGGEKRKRGGAHADFPATFSATTAGAEAAEDIDKKTKTGGLFGSGGGSDFLVSQSPPPQSPLVVPQCPRPLQPQLERVQNASSLTLQHSPVPPALG